MTNRWTSPELAGLLAELAESPQSVLFGTAAGLGAAAQGRLPAARRVPKRWSGRESGLLSAEKEVLRVHREEVTHLVRQISFALTRRIPGLSASLDPVLDRAAQSRALPRPSLLEARRSLIELASEPSSRPLTSATQPLENSVAPIARLALAADIDLTDPREAIALLRQAQRIAPHPMTLQHTGFWLKRTGALAEARSVGLNALSISASPDQTAACHMLCGWAELGLGAYDASASSYNSVVLISGSVHMLATRWMCELGAETGQADETARQLLKDLARGGQVIEWFRSLETKGDSDFISQRARSGASLRLIQELREVMR